MKIPILKLLSLLLLVFTFSVQAQMDEKVLDALEKANEAQNPNEILRILKAVEPEINQASDTLHADYLLTYGIAYAQLSIIDSALYYLKACESFTREKGFQYVRVQCLNAIGLTYMEMAEYENSIEAFQNALRITENTDSPSFKTLRMKLLGNLAGNYYDLQELEQALKYTKEAHQIASELKVISSLSHNNLRLAIIYKDLDSLDQAVKYLEQAQSDFKQLNDSSLILYAVNILGSVYQKKDELDHALKRFQEAAKIATSISTMDEIIRTRLSVASILVEMKRYSEAQTEAESLLVLATKHDLPNSVRNALDLLYRIALNRSDFKTALNYRNDYILIADSLDDVEVRSKVAELETRYETEKKENEIVQLTLSNEIKDVRLRKNQIIMISIGLGSILLVIGMIVFFRLRLKKKQAEKEASELQVEALKERFIELHSSPADLAVKLDFKELNQKLNTPLTEREFEVIKLSLEGKTNTEIGDKVFISTSTVKFHLRNAYNKMGVANRKEAFQLMLKTS